MEYVTARVRLLGKPLRSSSPSPHECATKPLHGGFLLAGDSRVALHKAPVYNVDMEQENIKSPVQLKEIIESKNPDVYVIQENINKCVMCGAEEDLRMRWCWDCADAQSILCDGVGMMGADTEDGEHLNVKLVNTRLKMLLDKGWRKTK